MRKSLWVGALAALFLAAVGGYNWVSVLSPLQAAQSGDPRNKGIEALAYHRHFVLPGEIVFDLRDVDRSVAPVDVDRLLLQFARELRDRSFERVYLAFRGEMKFMLEGRYFRQLGQEFGLQNPVYTLRTLPEHVLTPDGRPAFGSWTGGLLGVVGKQMEDLSDFHQRWFIDDLLRY